MEPWIKVERVTANKTQVRLIARRLGIHQMHAFGCCVMFWIYADAEMTEGGIIPLLDAAELDKIVGLDGFSEALVAVHWVEFTDEGAVLLKHDAHMSQHAKARAQNNKDVANSRARKGKASAGGACKDDALQGCKGPTLPEESREEDKRTTTSPTPSSGQTARAAAVEGDEREKIRSEGGDWAKVLRPLIDAGVIYAAKTIRSAQKRLTPRKTLDLVDVFQANRERLPDPRTLMTRIETGGADDDPLTGWGKSVSAPKRETGPTFYDLLEDYERDLNKRGVKGDERVRLVDEFYVRHGQQAGPQLQMAS